MIISTIQPGDTIQSFIDLIHSGGGGVLNFNPTGTYNVTSDITLYDNINLNGNGSVLDFGGGAFTIKASGSNVYTDGTITSINGGVNVIGDTTLWLSNVIPFVSQFFFNGQWMMIAGVVDDITLVLAEGYDGPTFSSGASYRIATPIQHTKLENLTIRNSTTNGVTVSDARFLDINTTIIQNCVNGVNGQYVTEFSLNGLSNVLNLSDGISISNGGRFNWSSVNSVSNAGHGVVLNAVRSAGFSEGTSNSKQGDGFNITNCSNIVLQSFDANVNSSNGVNAVSGNSILSFLNSTTEANGGGGIVLSASSNNTKITNADSFFNFGYGIDILYGSSVNTIIVGCETGYNSSGGLNDNGTGTLKSTTVNIFA